MHGVLQDPRVRVVEALRDAAVGPLLGGRLLVVVRPAICEGWVVVWFSRMRDLRRGCARHCSSFEKHQPGGLPHPCLDQGGRFASFDAFSSVSAESLYPRRPRLSAPSRATHQKTHLTRCLHVVYGVEVLQSHISRTDAKTLKGKVGRCICKIWGRSLSARGFRLAPAPILPRIGQATRYDPNSAKPNFGRN